MESQLAELELAPSGMSLSPFLFDVRVCAKWMNDGGVDELNFAIVIECRPGFIPSASQPDPVCPPFLPFSPLPPPPLDFGLILVWAI